MRYLPATLGLATRDGLSAIAMLTIAGAIRLPFVGYPLVEAHAFRQTQTAYTTVIYHREGINLLHTPLPVLGPPWEVPFEFPLFQGIAASLMNLGLSIEPAVRLTGLAFFLVTGIALWVFLWRNLSRAAADVSLLVFLFSPFALEWSRASLIDYAAAAPAVASVGALFEWDRSDRRRWLALACLLAFTCSLVKITTAIVWLLPALAVLRKRPVGILVAVSLLVGVQWTTYADSIKETGVLTSLLTSGSLTEWNFGRLDERLDPWTWLAVVWVLTPVGRQAGSGSDSSLTT